MCAFQPIDIYTPPVDLGIPNGLCINEGTLTSVMRGLHKLYENGRNSQSLRPSGSQCLVPFSEYGIPAIGHSSVPTLGRVISSTFWRVSSGSFTQLR